MAVYDLEEQESIDNLKAWWGQHGRLVIAAVLAFIVAVAGVQTWKFEPATYRGENVRVWATQRVRFNLS